MLEPFKMGPTFYAETSVTICTSTLRDIPQELKYGLIVMGSKPDVNKKVNRAECGPAYDVVHRLYQINLYF
jgi:hypothetical protein